MTFPPSSLSPLPFPLLLFSFPLLFLPSAFSQSVKVHSREKEEGKREELLEIKRPLLRSEEEESLVMVMRRTLTHLQIL